MVEDGIAILKVGPAVTYRFREALFMFSHMEEILVDKRDRANFPEVLERVMLEEPSNWENHYHGTPRDIRLARKYSYSDRCRYYFTHKDVKGAIDRLLANMNATDIPMNLLHQYMPAQYEKVLRGKLPLDAYELLFDSILEIAKDYEYAIGK